MKKYKIKKKHKIKKKYQMKKEHKIKKKYKIQSNNLKYQNLDFGVIMGYLLNVQYTNSQN